MAAVKPAVSPLAPKTTPTLPRIAGVKLAAGASGVRYEGRDDVMLAVLPAGATIAGVLTKSKCSSAPVDWCKKNLPRGKVRAILVNAGNANAFTGKLGDKAVEESTRAVAQALGCPRNEVFMASTGVIGQPLDWEKIAAIVPALIKGAREDGWAAAAGAIMTTDTFPKLATRQAKIGERTVTLNGFLKGSGMIAPDMATMLGFVFTDAKIPGSVLQKLVADARRQVAELRHRRRRHLDQRHPAAGRHRRGPPRADRGGRRPGAGRLQARARRGADRAGAAAGARRRGRHQVRHHQCRRRLVQRRGAQDRPGGRQLAAGQDRDRRRGRQLGPHRHGGRQVGRARRPRQAPISIGGVKITDGGQVVPNYDETPVAKHIKGTDIVIDIDLGIGRGRATVWTCDLTHGYIDINGSYRS